MIDKTWKQKLLFILECHFSSRLFFTLDEVYQVAVGSLQFFYPKNNTVTASIRYNLERLRDDGCIRFVDYNGLYSW